MLDFLLFVNYFYCSYIIYYYYMCIVKEGFGSGFGGWVWLSVKMINDKLFKGIYIVIFEIFIFSDFRVFCLSDEILII